MKNIVKIHFWVIITLTIIGCNFQKTLQEYFVEKSDRVDFQMIKINPNEFLKNKKFIGKDSEINFIENIHILSYSYKDSLQFEKEKNEINSILSNEKYQNLLRLNKYGGKFKIDYEGTDDNIKEVVIYGVQPKQKIFLVRIPTNNLAVSQLSEFVQKMDNLPIF